MKPARSTEDNGEIHGYDSQLSGPRLRLRWSRLLAACVVAAVTLVGPDPASAETTRFKLRGQEAVAAFSSTDATGCIRTNVFVAALDAEVKTAPGRADADSRTMAVVSRYDTCTHTQLLDAQGEVLLPADAFVITPLESATLNATIPVVDLVSGTSLPLAVSLTWTAEGGSSRVRDHFQVKAPTFTVNARFNAISQDAAAVGTISEGSTNLTPSPADLALLNSVKTGVLEISR